MIITSTFKKKKKKQLNRGKYSNYKKSTNTFFRLICRHILLILQLCLINKFNFFIWRFPFFSESSSLTYCHFPSEQKLWSNSNKFTYFFLRMLVTWAFLNFDKDFSSFRGFGTTSWWLKTSSILLIVGFPQKKNSGYQTIPDLICHSIWT